MRGTPHADPELPSMIAAILPIWIPDWAHDCCGTRVWLNAPGTFHLTLGGNARIEADDGPDSVLVRHEGGVVLVGSVVPADSLRPGETGTVVQSGGVRFGISDEPPAARVRCIGELTEVRHGYPCGRTSAVVRRISLVPKYYVARNDADGLEFAGFGSEEPLYALEHDRPEDLPGLTKQWASVAWKYKLLVEHADEPEESDDVSTRL